jgi:hypothetical protein
MTENGTNAMDPSSSTDQRRQRGSRLPEDWTPPPVAALSPLAARLVAEWPSGAYEAVCEAFKLHWHSETRAIGCKRNWNAALAKWLINEHSTIMRNARAGVSFAPLATSRPANAGSASRLMQPVKAKASEDSRSDALHAALRRQLEDASYDTWIAPCALIADAAGVTVIARGEFARSWIKDRYESKISAAARAVLGVSSSQVRFAAEV